MYYRKPSRKQHDRQYDTTKKNPIGGTQFYHMQVCKIMICMACTIKVLINNPLAAEFLGTTG